MTTFIGAHGKGGTSIFKTFDELHSWNANIMQVFIGNPLQGMKPTVYKTYMGEFGEQIHDYLIKNNVKLVIHSPYILNFASPKNNYFGIDHIIKELEISDFIGSIGCVLHVGKFVVADDEDSGIENMYNNIKSILQSRKSKSCTSKLIIETAAGQGTELLTDIKDLANFYNRFTNNEKTKLGICVDTAHIWATGVDLSTPAKVKEYFNEFNKLFGKDALTLIHLNNSKVALGCCKDRHANIIGITGKIPVKSLKQVVLIGKQMNVPLILETPSDMHKEELEWMHNIVK